MKNFRGNVKIRCLYMRITSLGTCQRVWALNYNFCVRVILSRDWKIELGYQTSYYLK